MSNIYDDFREVQQIRTQNYDHRSAAFITVGKLAKTITHIRKDENISAALVFRHDEGPDEVLVYTFIEDDLQRGDYFAFENLEYLVYEENKLSDPDINHKKQRAVECNVTFDFEGAEFKGYFKSTMRRYNDENFEGKQLLVPEEKPLLMLPSTATLTINNEFDIEGKPWRIIEYDKITNKGITYYYLERGITKNITPSIEPTSFIAPEPENTLAALVHHTFELPNGEFVASPEVEVLKRSLTSVTFTIPNGVNQVTINDVIYKVV